MQRASGIVIGCLCLLVPLLALAADPVDTRQYGLISTGMSEAEVQRRLGPPGKALEGPKTYVEVWVNGRKEFREKRRTVWVYQGTNQVLTSYFSFEDGRLVEKKKSQ